MKPFYFKEFTIRQTNSALKVGTDAMLLGSAVKQTGNEQLGLDIGAGTGVLSLMLLQRNPTIKIDAVEIDNESYNDCLFNAINSPWSDRISCLNGDVFQLDLKNEYSLIVCNPPYYEYSLASQDSKLNIAKHGGEFFLPKLFDFVEQKLTLEGLFWCILPFDNAQSWIEKGNAIGLNVIEQVSVYSKNNLPSRLILAFSKQQKQCLFSNLIIRNENGSYTEDYISLTKDFHGVSLK